MGWLADCAHAPSAPVTAGDNPPGPPGLSGYGVPVAIAGYAAAGARGSLSASSSIDEAERVALGRKMFFDASLSGSGRLSCASCHSPAHAYAAPNTLPVQLGGTHLDRQGLRAVPSLRYVLNKTPIWFEPRAANPVERLEEASETAPAGGFAWDGRFNTLPQQARFPLLDPREMANSSEGAVVAALERSPYAGDFRRVFGAQIFSDRRQAFERAVEALASFELEDASFHPYSSRFDRYLDGKATLTAQELRGKKLFDDPRSGGCAMCHIDARGADGSHPLFTDFQFEALGVPRNRALAANADPHYADLGLCGPLRRDQRTQSRYCGMFETPSLRNVATRHAFFHNGRFASLKEALRFYVQRDTNPEKWYPKTADGSVTKFDDIPAALRANVDTSDAPLTQKRGAKPVWNEAQIDAVAAFLATLTDADAEGKPSP